MGYTVHVLKTLGFWKLPAENILEQGRTGTLTTDSHLLR